MRQLILPLGGILRDLRDYFGDELERLTADELAAVAADAAGLGLVTMNEYRRSIGSGNLKSYAACIVAPLGDREWLNATFNHYGEGAL
jgi:hypothetical protein